MAETVGGFLGYETNFLHAMAQLKSFHKISNGRAYLYGTPFQGKQKEEIWPVLNSNYIPIRIPMQFVYQYVKLRIYHFQDGKINAMMTQSYFACNAIA